jgi:hypothetical protein
MPFADIDRNRSEYSRPMEGPISSLSLRARLINFYRQNEANPRSASAYIEEREGTNRVPCVAIGDAANQAVSVISYVIADSRVRRRCDAYHLEVQVRYPQAKALSHSTVAQNS